MGVNNLRETQETTLVFGEWDYQIFSPGVHSKFLTWKYPQFCALWVHIKNNQKKIRFSFQRQKLVNFSIHNYSSNTC